MEIVSFGSWRDWGWEHWLEFSTRRVQVQRHGTYCGRAPRKAKSTFGIARKRRENRRSSGRIAAAKPWVSRKSSFAPRTKPDARRITRQQRKRELPKICNSRAGCLLRARLAVAGGFVWTKCLCL